MRILTRNEFIKMPEGTVFSYYSPCIFSGLFIKDSCREYSEDSNDFLMSDIIGAIMNCSSDDYFKKCKEMEEGKSLITDFEFSGREGLFDDSQLFAIYEKDDIKSLIIRLAESIK